MFINLKVTYCFSSFLFFMYQLSLEGGEDLIQVRRSHSGCDLAILQRSPFSTETLRLHQL